MIFYYKIYIFIFNDWKIWLYKSNSIKPTTLRPKVSNLNFYEAPVFERVSRKHSKASKESHKDLLNERYLYGMKEQLNNDSNFLKLVCSTLELPKLSNCFEFKHNASQIRILL